MFLMSTSRSIVPNPGALPPAGLSNLAELAATLSTNQWGSISMNNMTQSLITRGDSDSILSYCKNGQWDPVNKRHYFWGSTHGTQYYKRIIMAPDVADTNPTWEVSVDGEPEPDGVEDHGYQHFAIRPSDGQQFIRHYASSTISTRTPSGPFSTIATLPGTLFFDWNVANALGWMPALNSGSGGLVFAGSRTVYGSNATYSSWTELDSVAGLNGDYHNVMAIGVNGLAYFGGGNGSTNFWRVNANGTLTQRANLPFSVGADGAGGQGGLFSGATGNVIAVSTGGSVREFDDGANAWSSEITTLPFTPSDNTYFGTTIPEFGVITFVYISSGLAPSMTMYVLKH